MSRVHKRRRPTMVDEKKYISDFFLTFFIFFSFWLWRKKRGKRRRILSLIAVESQPFPATTRASVSPFFGFLTEETCRHHLLFFSLLRLGSSFPSSLCVSVTGEIRTGQRKRKRTHTLPFRMKAILISRRMNYNIFSFLPIAVIREWYLSFSRHAYSESIHSSLFPLFLRSGAAVETNGEICFIECRKKNFIFKWVLLFLLFHLLLLLLSPPPRQQKPRSVSHLD